MRCLLTIAILAGALSGQAHGDHPVKCGWSLLPDTHLDRVAAYRARPTRQTAYLAPSGAFLIHYDTTGAHSPPLSTTQPDGTPDWIVEIAAAVEWARYLLVDSLGFDPPEDDGDGIYDVYLEEYNGMTYGNTFYTDGYGPIPPYTVIDNDFAEDEHYYTHGLGAARVTSAHEYFHAVHVGYRFPDWDFLYFYELSSTWFEEIAYPEVNDWVYWFDGFASDPTTNMTETNGYSIAAFGHYLTYATGSQEVIPDAWERFRTQDAATAITASLDAFNSGNLTIAWTDFIARLLFNGVSPSQYFHPDQHYLAALSLGPAEVVADSYKVTFDNLAPGQASIQSLMLGGAANLYLSIEQAPVEYAARVAIRGGSPYLSGVGREKWYTSGLDNDSEMILVVGGERDSVVLEVRVSNVQLALNSLFPNPITPGRQGTLSLEYMLATDVPQGDLKVVIYDLRGREVYREELGEPESGQMEMIRIPSYSMQRWPAGIYFLRLTLGASHSARRPFILLK